MANYWSRDWSKWAQMGPGPNGPNWDPGPMGPMGPGPNGPKWDPGPMDPMGPGPKWVQWDPGPMGPMGPGPKVSQKSKQKCRLQARIVYLSLIHI